MRRSSLLLKEGRQTNNKVLIKAIPIQFTLVVLLFSLASHHGTNKLLSVNEVRSLDYLCFSGIEEWVGEQKVSEETVILAPGCHKLETLCLDEHAELGLVAAEMERHHKSGQGDTCDVEAVSDPDLNDKAVLHHAHVAKELNQEAGKPREADPDQEEHHHRRRSILVLSVIRDE